VAWNALNHANAKVKAKEAVAMANQSRRDALKWAVAAGVPQVERIY
jgi:hypothetical protein